MGFLLPTTPLIRSFALWVNGATPTGDIYTAWETTGIALKG